MLLLPAIWGWWVSFTFSTKNGEINLISPRNCTEKSLKLLLFMKDGEKFSTSSLDWDGDIRCGLSPCSKYRRRGRKRPLPLSQFYYLYVLFVLSMVSMVAYFRDGSSQVPFKRYQIYKDFGFRFCLHFTGGLTPWLRALVSQPSPEQRTRASDGATFKTLYTRPLGHPGVQS